MKQEPENKLETLLLILNESDLLSPKSAENLFSRFSVIEKEGVLNLIVYVDFLKTISVSQKTLLVQNIKNQIQETLSLSHFDSGRVAVIESYDDYTSFTASNQLSVLFVLGLGGRDELKLILSDFIQNCRKNKSKPSEMTPDYISDRLKLPFEPDFVISHSKHTLTDFMIWQTVYSEYYFFEKDVGRLTDADFMKAFDSFYNRERRYGA